MKKKLFKNKLQMIIYIVVFILCIALFIVIGTTDYNGSGETESQKFSALYSMVGEDNVYVFASSSDVLNIINGKSGIILLGFPANEWTNYYAYILNEVAKEEGIEEIYYYDFLSDRENANGTYETIVNKLENYVIYDDLGNSDLNAPTIVMIKNGEVVAYFSETAKIEGTITPNVYYTDYRMGLTYQMFKTAVLEYLGSGE